MKEQQQKKNTEKGANNGNIFKRSKIFIVQNKFKRWKH